MTEGDVDPGPAHFREEDWLDFARQLGDGERRARVARHLEDGCTECERTLQVWSAVLRVADQESSVAPPEAAVDAMKRRFPARREPGFGERIAAEVALLFDSFRQPQFVGVRGPGSPSRQLLYKAGRYTIKLQIEPTTGEGVSIVGQILDEEDPEGVLRNVAVRARAGRHTLDRAVTNELGEFHLEPGQGARLQLSVGVPDIGTFTVASSDPPRARARTGNASAGRSGRIKQARPR